MTLALVLTLVGSMLLIATPVSACFFQSASCEGSSISNVGSGAGGTFTRHLYPPTHNVGFGNTTQWIVQCSATGGCSDWTKVKVKMENVPTVPQWQCAFSWGTGTSQDRHGNPLTPGTPITPNVFTELPYGWSKQFILTVTAPDNITAQSGDHTSGMQMYLYIEAEAPCNQWNHLYIHTTAQIPGPPNDPPIVDLTSPTGGEEWSGTHAITWTASDAEDDPENLTISIDYSPDNTIWTNIANNEANDGTFSWDTAALDVTGNIIVPDGDYFIRASAVDTRLGVGTDVSTNKIKIDNPTPPLIEEILSPTKDQVIGVSIDIQWVATDDEDNDADLTIDILYANDASGLNWKTLADGILNTGLFSWDLTQEDEDKTYHVLKFRAHDSDGMSAELWSSTFFIENPDIPTITLTGPKPSDPPLSGSNDFNIFWDVSDDEDSNELLETELKYSSDAGTTWNSIATGLTGVSNAKLTLASGSYNWDTTKVPDGDQYLIKAIVKDSTQQTAEDETSGTISVYNNDEPSITISSPKANEVWTGINDIEWVASDEEDDTFGKDLQIYITYNGYYKLGDENGEENDGVFTLDTTSFSDGTYTLKIRVEDSDDVTTFKEVQFQMYNNFDPTVSIDYPMSISAPLGGLIDIQWTADDGDTDAEEELEITLEYSSDNGNIWNPIASGEANDGLYSWDTTALPDGDTYKLRVKATEKDTDEELSAEVISDVFKIDNPDQPEGSFVTPPAQEVLSGSYQIKWTMTDADGDEVIATLQYSRDKITWLDIVSNLAIDTITWDTTLINNGDLYLRLILSDGTTDSVEVISGMVTVNNAISGDDAVIEGEDEQTKISESDSSNALLYVGIIIAVVAIIAVLGLMFFMKSKPPTPPIPPPPQQPLTPQPQQPQYPQQPQTPQYQSNTAQPGAPPQQQSYAVGELQYYNDYNQ